MKIDINVSEEMAIKAALENRIVRLETLLKTIGQDTFIKNMIFDAKSALNKIEQANNEQAQEIMRNEG